MGIRYCTLTAPNLPHTQPRKKKPPSTVRKCSKRGPELQTYWQPPPGHTVRKCCRKGLLPACVLSPDRTAGCHHTVRKCSKKVSRIATVLNTAAVPYRAEVLPKRGSETGPFCIRAYNHCSATPCRSASKRGSETDLETDTSCVKP